MSARCSSCRYPLSVSDSVACHECRSHFHIDCAQLVGFPLFELSVEPGKNTFHCSTCQLLPLPTPKGDSDSSGDEGGQQGMPSRQVDYALDGDCDLAEDMNEVKGSIQDLSDLCKDMLREINDLKSISLTLRCCVENLRHDNEKRDAAISELSHRLDLLEGKNFEGDTDESTLWNVDRLGGKDDSERCSTSEIECTKNEISESLLHNKSYVHGKVEKVELEDTSKHDHNTDYPSSAKEETETSESEEESSFWGKQDEGSVKDNWGFENKQNEGTELQNSDYKCVDKVQQQCAKGVDKAKEEVKAEITSETNESRRDWSLRGNEATEADKEDEASEEEEEESEEETETEDTEPHSWKRLKEEIEIATKPEDENTETSADDDFWDLNQGEESDENGAEKEEASRVRKSVRWDENIGEDESDTEAELSQRELTEEADVSVETKAEDLSEAEGEALDEGDVIAERGNERLEEGEGDLRLESGEFSVERDHHLETNEATLEEQPPVEFNEGLAEGESRLDGDRVPTEGVPHLEGEQGEEGESRLQGQEVPEEGEAEPPESPPPVHTEEDLWMYLKDTVSSVRPATVEEFVQNLIGTLQHVPEEFLKPVIEANMKRANSPSITDGEHLKSPEGVRPGEGEAAEEDCIAKNQGSLEGENYANPLEAEDAPAFGEECTAPTEEVSSVFLGDSTALQATD